MFRLYLPAAIVLGHAAMAQDLGVCRNIPYDQDNCVRVLACIGDQGLQFDGKARGWDQGHIIGQRSDFTNCTGTWDSNGPLGTGVGQLTCEDGVTVDVIYYTQDNVTGTVIGRGKDSLGRNVQVWSGENVLQFLTPDGAHGARLPCFGGDIPIS
ncbi:MAG: hypothetical protein AAFQ64_04015 [Pseudomonadota bacterium]